MFFLLLLLVVMMMVQRHTNSLHINVYCNNTSTPAKNLITHVGFDEHDDEKAENFYI